MELSATDVWSRICEGVRDRVPAHAFKTWIESAKVLALTADELLVEARNPFHVEWLEDKYGSMLDAEGKHVLGRPLHIRVQCSELPDEIPVPSLLLADEDETSNRDVELRPPGRPRSVVHAAAPPPPVDPGLFKRYTFERFVVGANNQLAEAACRAVAEKPGRMYNPLFLYGGVGLGKTHLMHAIGHHVLAAGSKRVAYLSSEQFMNELVSAIREGKTPAFRDRYRRIDLLLVDDVQFLRGRESTQEEFFHTFNSLYDMQRQIVVTSDRPPKDMEGVEARLVSRFEWGLVVDLRPPDFETRMAILRKKADDEGLSLADDVLDLVAQACTASVRELEGAVLKLLAVSSVWNQEITRDFARRVLALRRQEQQPRRIATSPQRIKEYIASGWRVRLESLAAKTRTRHVAEARQVAMYAMRELLGMALGTIGNFFGDRDHTTVLYSIRKVETRMSDDDEFRARVESAMRHLRDSSDGPFPD